MPDGSMFEDAGFQLPQAKAAVTASFGFELPTRVQLVVPNDRQIVADWFAVWFGQEENCDA
jgi:hypothetical protein